ncbi:hypothetical protein J6590_044488 [Homalodisca vitripennis]|nr:hypothetical protein J6590_044488 [Homalodisca vitripennis]
MEIRSSDMLTCGLQHVVYFTAVCITQFNSVLTVYKGKIGTQDSLGKPTPYVPQIHYLFVFGKLKKDEGNHYWMENPEHGLSKFLGIGQTVKKYPLTVGKYKTPVLINKPGTGHKILGEIYLVDTFMLRTLDLLEGSPVFNVRKMDIVRLFLEDNPKGKEMMCWIYFARVDTENLSGLTFISEYSSKNIAES